MASQTRAAAVKAGAKLPQDHAARAEALDQPVDVEIGSEVAGVSLRFQVPRSLVDSYEAVQAVYAGFAMPVMQEFDEGTREGIIEAARDESGKVRNSVVQRVLVAALTQAAQGN